MRRVILVVMILERGYNGEELKVMTVGTLVVVIIVMVMMVM